MRATAHARTNDDDSDHDDDDDARWSNAACPNCSAASPAVLCPHALPPREAARRVLDKTVATIHEASPIVSSSPTAAAPGSSVDDVCFTVEGQAKLRASMLLQQQQRDSSSSSSNGGGGDDDDDDDDAAVERSVLHKAAAACWSTLFHGVVGTMRSMESVRASALLKPSTEQASTWWNDYTRRLEVGLGWLLAWLLGWLLGCLVELETLFFTHATHKHCPRGVVVRLFVSFSSMVSRSTGKLVVVVAVVVSVPLPTHTLSLRAKPQHHHLH